MSVKYKTFDGERVSEEWYLILSQARKEGVSFILNDGARTLSDQEYLYNGYINVGPPKFNLAAKPSSSAPHIRVGRFDHAIDVNALDGGAARLKSWAAKKGLNLAYTVSKEPWHLEMYPAPSSAWIKKKFKGGDNLPLKKGDEGKLVRKSIKHLNRWLPDAKLTNDGIFGPKVLKAVKRFQEIHFGPKGVDGVIGQKTYKKLKSRQIFSKLERILLNRFKSSKTPKKQRQNVLKRLTNQRKNVAATAKADNNNWKKYNRGGRYNILKRLTKKKVSNNQQSAQEKPKPKPVPTVPKTPVKIIDISNNNGDIDWVKVKADGISGVYVKSSEGEDYIDKLCTKSRSQEIAKNGLKRGLYHYVHPRQRDAKNEVDFFVKRAKACGGWGDLIPVLDIETTHLNTEDTQAYIKRLVSAFKAETNITPIIYTYPSFWNDKVKTRNKYGCPLWIAHYGVKEPIIPGGWHNYIMWQYTAEGRVNGVNTYCDINICPDLNKLLLKN